MAGTDPAEILLLCHEEIEEAIQLNKGWKNRGTRQGLSPAMVIFQLEACNY
jgi:hypothetical protein